MRRRGRFFMLTYRGTPQNLTDAQVREVLDAFPKLWNPEHPLSELRLPRFENNLCDLHRKLPKSARVLRVRYTRVTMIALYKS